MYPADIAARVLKVLYSANKLDGEWVTRYQGLAPGDSSKFLAEFCEGNAERENWVVKILCRAYKMTEVVRPPSQVSPDLISKMPKSLIDQHRFMPLEIEGRYIKVGVINPNTVELVGQIKGTSGLNVQFVLIPPSLFTKLRNSRAVRDVLENDVSAAPVVSTRRQIRWNVNDDTLVADFCNDIIATALETGSSDIHIEAFRDSARVRMRRDGVLQIFPSYADYLWKNYGAVITRFKIMAECDIAEKRVAQDGAITTQGLSGEDVDLRFNVVPTKNGERIVMRILAGNPALSLDKLGFSRSDYRNIVDAINAPQGMVLVTGPTGSGKTTTLYGALQHINVPERNIMTAEDPVEYYLEGAGQVQANERVGLSFANILRSFLRQDPEVILVGEIRDQETVEIAVKAALTGHLLLSTLHTNDSISTINRLLNMGVPNFMVASALSLVVAQRLARKSCQSCLEPDEAGTREQLLRMGFDEAEVGTVQPMRGAGCKTCGGSGYKGRQGIYEVLKVSGPIEAAILQNKQSSEILEIAISEGFQTMQQIGREFIKRHVISIEEYQRTLVMDG